MRALDEAIFDLDVHLIPARGCEPAHYHYDVRFLVQAMEDRFRVSEESFALAWVPVERVGVFTNHESVLRMGRKWQAWRGDWSRSRSPRGTDPIRAPGDGRRWEGERAGMKNPAEPAVTNTLESEQLLERFLRLQIWTANGQRAPHKPLLALWAIGRCLRDEVRLASYAKADSTSPARRHSFANSKTHDVARESDYTTLNPEIELDDSTVKDVPVLAQRALESKCDLRVTVVGEAVFTVRVLARGQPIRGDWRRTPKQDLEFHDCELDPEIAERCRLLTRRLGLSFAAIDLIENEEGTFFIEVNPTGEWGWLSNANRPIDVAIARRRARRRVAWRRCGDHRRRSPLRSRSQIPVTGAERPWRAQLMDSPKQPSPGPGEAGTESER